MPASQKGGPELDGRCTAAAEATGVGLAVVEMLRAAKPEGDADAGDDHGRGGEGAPGPGCVARAADGTAREAGDAGGRRREAAGLRRVGDAASEARVCSQLRVPGWVRAVENGSRKTKAMEPGQCVVGRGGPGMVRYRGLRDAHDGDVQGATLRHGLERREDLLYARPPMAPKKTSASE